MTSVGDMGAGGSTLTWARVCCYRVSPKRSENTLGLFSPSRLKDSPKFHPCPASHPSPPAENWGLPSFSCWEVRRLVTEGVHVDKCSGFEERLPGGMARGSPDSWGDARRQATGALPSSILTQPRAVIPPPIPQGRTLCSPQSALLPAEADSRTAALPALFCLRDARSSLP